MQRLLVFLLLVALGLGVRGDIEVSPPGEKSVAGLLDEVLESKSPVKEDIKVCRPSGEGGLKKAPASDEIKADLKKEESAPSNETVKTTETKVIKDTDETGNEKGNETVIEKTTETSTKPDNASVTKTVETKVVKDEDGNDTGEKAVVEKETLKKTTPDNESTIETVEHKKTTDKDGNEKDEETVVKKESKVDPVTNTPTEETTERKVTKELDEEGNVKNVTVTEQEVKIDNVDKNETSAKEGASESEEDGASKPGKGKPTEPETTEQKEKIIEKLPGNKTREIVVEEKKEIIPSSETVKGRSGEGKNVNGKAAGGKDAKKGAEVEKEVCKPATGEPKKGGEKEKDKTAGPKKGADKEHKNEEKIEDLKHEIAEVKKEIKEEKDKGAAVGKCIERGGTVVPAVGVEKVAPVSEVEKVVEKTIPVSTEEVEKVVVPTTEGVVSVPKAGEKVIEKIVTPVTEEIATGEKVVTVPTVVEKVSPVGTEGAAVIEKVVVEKTGPVVEKVAAGEKVTEKVPLVKVVPVPKGEEKIIEKLPPLAKEVETKETAAETVPAVVKEVVTEKVVPPVVEKVVTIPKEGEKVGEKKAPIVKATITEKKVLTGKGGSVTKQEKTVEKVVPPVQEKATPVLKVEAEKEVPVVKEETVKEPEKTVEEVVSVPAAKKGAEEVSPGEQKRTVIIADEVTGDSRPGPFEVVKDVKLVKVAPVIKSGDKVVKEFPPVIKEEVVREKITPVAKVGGKLVPKGDSVVLTPKSNTPEGKKVFAATETPVTEVSKAETSVPAVKSATKGIETVPATTKKVVIATEK